MKTRLVPQMNRDAMTSTWLGGSCDLRKTLIGGRLHCASISPAVPRPSRNYSIHKQRKDIVNSYLVRRLIQLSRCSRAEVELNTIEFDTTVARRLNRVLDFNNQQHRQHQIVVP